MDFCIQAGAPRSLDVFNDDDKTLCEAMETVFPLFAEFAFIIWNNIYIPITYKYDISLMLDDIITMLEKLTGPSGTYSIHWPSNTFEVTWAIEWEGNDVKIHGEWNSVIGNLEGLLSDNNNLELKKESFIYEWKGILENAYRALSKAGYNEDILENMDRLKKACQGIPKLGILYRDK
jgi:hypothetical protein